MRPRSVVATLLLLCALFAAAGSAGADPGGPNGPSAPASNLGTAFTYQGRLNTGGTPVTGSCGMAFRLYDDVAAGAQVGAALTTTVPVAAGYFTVSLDFGSGAFSGPARWLDIRVKCGADPAFTSLSPRQSLTPAPYALALPGLYTQQNAESPNLIGGYSGNIITGADTFGVTIAGGGSIGQANRVEGGESSFSFIGAGRLNVIHGFETADNVIAGGVSNAIYGDGSYESAIGGGADNTITGTDMTESVIAGGIGNRIIGANVEGAFIGGGEGNHATNNDATVAGGYFNTNDGWEAAIGGGAGNHATAREATVAGGFGNLVSGAGATIGGGGYDGVTSRGNQAVGAADVIAGGISNTASFNASAVGGGEANKATNNDSTVAGGYYNTADGWNATIGGGTFNHAGGAGAFIGGGGWDGSLQAGNTASGNASVVAGGLNNIADGNYASVPGGNGNHATGAGSFAAGVHATASNGGAFVWSCNGCASTSSAATGQFVVNASGGVWIGSGATGGPTGSFISTNLISTSVGARLTIGGVWTDVSDVNAKTDFAPVDNLLVLNTLMAMPVQTWRYKVETDGSRHMGPTAQDFYAAFNVGNDNTHIAPLDTSGVALAAIQGLDQLVQTQKTQIDTLQAQAAAQQQTNATLQTRLTALEQGAPAPAASAPLSLGWLLFGALLLLNLGGLAGFVVARALRTPAAAAAGAQ